MARNQGPKRARSRSARSVAAAQGISVSLAKKRLQLGRDLLRRNLWRRLGDVLRDILPSTREWKRKARASSLVLLAALPAPRVLGGSFASSAGSIRPGISSIPTTKALVASAGALLMAKKLMAVSVCLLLLAAASFWAGRSSRGPEAPSEPGIAAPGGSGKSAVLAELRRQQAASEKRIGDLEAENRRLKEIAARLPAAPPDGPAEKAGVPGSGLDWKEFSSLVLRSQPALSAVLQGRALSDDEEAQEASLRGELLKLSGRAKGMTPYPFFDEVIFGEITTALFRDSLGLDPGQVEELKAIDGEIFAKVPAEVEAKSPLEKYVLRREMVWELRERLQGILNDDQRERWAPLWRFAESVFHYGNEYSLGVDKDLTHNVGDQIGRAHV